MKNGENVDNMIVRI